MPMSAPGRFIACVSKSKQVSNRNAGDAKSLGSGVDVEPLSLLLHEAPDGGPSGITCAHTQFPQGRDDWRASSGAPLPSIVREGE